MKTANPKANHNIGSSCLDPRQYGATICILSGSVTLSNEVITETKMTLVNQGWPFVLSHYCLMEILGLLLRAFPAYTSHRL